MILELPGSSYDTIKKLCYATEIVTLTLGGEKIADVVITNLVQSYATWDDTHPLGLTVELRAIIKIAPPPRKFKEGAYYWVKLKEKYMYQSDENPWKTAQYLDETTDEEAGFRLCNYILVYAQEDFDEIGEEVLPPKKEEKNDH